jgi:hypothetical protein
MTRAKFQVRSACSGNIALATAASILSLAGCGETGLTNRRTISGAVIENSAADGSLTPITMDKSFNGSGVVRTRIEGRDIKPNAMAVSPDGSILVTGTIAESARHAFTFPPVETVQRRDMFVGRYKSDGQIDISYGGASSGMATITVSVGNVAVDSRAYHVAYMADGGVVVAGAYGSGASAGLVVTRLTPSGALATGFGVGGVKQIACAGGGSFPAGISVVDGKIFVAVNCNDSSGVSRIVVHRLNDVTGVSEAATLEASMPRMVAYSMLSTGGKIYVGGHSDAAGSSPARKVLALARFDTATLSLDSNFGNNGIITNAAGRGDAIVTALVTGPDGRVAAIASTTGQDGKNDISVWMVSGVSPAASDCVAVAKFPAGIVPYSAQRISGNQLLVGGAVESDGAGLTLTSFTLGNNAADCGSAVAWDQSAGVGGFVKVDPVGRYDFIRSFAMTADNKVLAIAPSYESGSGDRAISLTRFLVK